MTRKELIDRLKHIDEFAPTVDALRTLIADIEADGVLDVQAPSDIAETMHLPSGDVQRMKRALVEAGLTRDELRACSVADLIALHEAMP